MKIRINLFVRVVISCEYRIDNYPGIFGFRPARPPYSPLGCVGAWLPTSTGASFGMPSIDPEVNSRKTAKQGLVRWMDRRISRIRDDCDADTARTKAKLIGELLHTFLYDHQIYFDKREVGHPAWGGNDITRLCVEADAGDADAKEEVIKLQSYLMSEAVEADEVLAVISEHRHCEIGIASRPGCPSGNLHARVHACTLTSPQRPPPPM